MENVDVLKAEIEKVEVSLNHLNEDQQIIVLINAASRVGTEKWKSEALKMMKRMDICPIN